MQINCPKCRGAASAEAWKILCPFCGQTSSPDEWSGEDKTLLRAALRMPAIMADDCIKYLAMFRPLKSRLSKAKGIKLLEEMQQLVTSPHVQWKTMPARPNRPDFWAAALKQLFDRKLQLPLSSHGYLRSIAYDLADKEDRENEYRRNRSERDGTFRKVPEHSPDPEPMTLDEIQAIRKANYGNLQKEKAA